MSEPIIPEEDLNLVDPVLPDLGGGGNPPEPDKEPPAGGQPENVEKLKTANSQLFKRAKDAEEENKRLKEKYEKNPPPPPNPPAVDAIDLAKIVGQLKDFDNPILDFIKTYAKGAGISPLEAVGKEEVKLFIQARKDKVAKDNSIPSSSDGGSPAGGLPSSEDIGKMSKEEHQKLERDFNEKQKAKGV